jgi:hypothetical protein
MKFNAKSASAFPPKNTNPPLPEGEYQFTIVSAKDGVSAKGNAMMIIELQIRGQSVVLKDYIVETALWKLKQLCECVCMADKFESGEVTAYDLEGCQGNVLLDIEEDPTGKYRPKNKVKKYLAMGEKPTKKEEKKAASFDDDAIPF